MALPLSGGIWMRGAGLGPTAAVEVMVIVMVAPTGLTCGAPF